MRIHELAAQRARRKSAITASSPRWACPARSSRRWDDDQVRHRAARVAPLARRPSGRHRSVHRTERPRSRCCSTCRCSSPTCRSARCRKRRRPRWRVARSSRAPASARAKAGCCPRSRPRTRATSTSSRRRASGGAGTCSTKVQAFHFKLGQGAKTGTGGHLPGPKVKGRIAEVRGLPEGTPAVSPADVSGLARRRRLPPVRRRGARPQRRDPDRREALGAAHRGRHRRRARDRRRLHHPRRSRWRHRCRAAVVPRQHLGADDSRARARPAPSRPAQAPRHHADHHRAASATRPISRRRSRSAPTRVAIANSAIQAIGCLGMRACHTNNCPVGIATQKQHLRARLPVDEAAQRLDRFLRATIELMQVLARACGHDHLSHFALERPDDVRPRYGRSSPGIEYGGVR